MTAVLATGDTAQPASFTFLDEALTALFALGSTVLQAQRCSLYRQAEDGTILHLYAEKGLPPDAQARCIAVEGTISGLVIRTGVPLLVQNVATCPTLPTHQDRYATPSFISVPLMIDNQAVGVFNAANRQDRRIFTEQDLQNAELVGRCMASAIHNDRLLRQAAASSAMDPVTCLPNEHYLRGRLEQEIARAHYDKTPLCLLLVRVNNYDALATQTGLQIANSLLRNVAVMASKLIRSLDVLVSYRPDTLAVILPSTSLEGAQHIARTLVREITHEKLPAQLRYDCESLDISIGSVALSLSTNATDFLRQAEDALELARDRGNAIAAMEGNTLQSASYSGTEALHHHSLYETVSLALRLGIPYLADPGKAGRKESLYCVPADLARSYTCFPVADENGTVTLAMADPTDTQAIHDISQRIRLAVYPVASPREAILQAIADYYK